MDLHDKWPHRWVTSKAESFSSSIHGTGVRALQIIKKGETVAVLGGVIVPKSQIHEYWEIFGHIGIQISDDFFIVPSTREEVDKGGVFNHSCSPNCGFSNSITLVALRDINESEELFFDYGFNETIIDPFSCHCGSPSCRKMITPNDWKLELLQETYFNYFSPYLKDKIKKN